MSATHNTRDNLSPARDTRRNVAKPSFRLGTWLRLHGLDILTMAAMGAVALGVHFAGPAPSRSFPLFNSGGMVAYPQFAYPLRDEIIPLWAAVLISFLAPVFFFTLFQARRRSLDDWLTTILGLLRSLITAAVIQVFIKWLIGGLRPHFLSVCQPSVGSGSQASGAGFASLMYDRTVCQGSSGDVGRALESMPAGHSTAAWAGLLYLALYFNAQLKVMSAHNPAYWKMVLFFAPLLGAFLISATPTIDKHFNWYDLLVGAIIGSATALVAFRQTFASVWDFRFNHILLPRATSLFHRKAFLPSGRSPFFAYQPYSQFLSHDLPFTREGGWGHGVGEQFVGAPFDATPLTSGLVSITDPSHPESSGAFGTHTGGVSPTDTTTKHGRAGVPYGPGAHAGGMVGNDTAGDPGVDGVTTEKRPHHVV